MPLFDFECRECGHKFDLIISNADKETARCPQCGAQNPKQLLSSFGTARALNIPESCSGCKSAGTGG